MRVNPDPSRSINLATYDGSPIPNRVGIDPSAWVIAQQQYFLSQSPIIGYRTVRRAPTGRYNCHGLVFGARRTQIDSPELPVNVVELLQRDRYRVTNDPQPGDIIVYRSEDDPDRVDHTGVILRTDDLGSVYVLSKWGELEEYEHHERACPYRGPIEYWTLRE